MRSRNARLIAALVALVVLLCAAPRTPAQIIHGQRPQIEQGLNYLSWDFSGAEEFTIAQWFIPITVITPIAENLELSLSSGASRSDADWELTGDDVSGFVDSRIQAAASFLQDQVVLSAGVSLPTGQTELTPVQQSLLFFLTSDFLNYPVKNPGEGLNVFGQLGFAVPVGSWVFGASGAVYVAGEYNPYDADLVYQPGMRGIGTIGIERRWDEGHLLAADVVVIHSEDDKADDAPIFRDGLQVDLRFQGRLAVGRGWVDAAVRYLARGEDDRPSPGDAELIRETQNHNGDDIRVRFSPHVRISPRVAAWFSYEAKILSANEYEETDALFEDAARIHGFGGGVDVRLSPKATGGIGIRVWNGSSDGAFEVGALDLTGFEIIQRLTITL